MDTAEQTIISIATGTGGLERGLECLGIKLKIAAFVEIEAFIIANLVAAMEAGKMGAAPIWADVKTFPAKYFRGKIHGITAGYPCQPFSNAGKREGTCDPRHIFPHILRIINTVEPIWCFFENVEGHLSLGFDEVYKSLHDIGYQVESGIFSAEEIGAPHQRKRLYILAIKLEYSDVTKIKRILFADEKEFTYSGSSSKANKLGHINNNDPGAKRRIISGKTGEIENSASRKDRQRMRPQFSNDGTVISNTGCNRSGKSVLYGQSKQLIQNGDYWPARPDELQYEWEEPRTIESEMGRSTDGYNYRIDLLRALGNGVVQQTASKAFITLLEKF